MSTHGMASFAPNGRISRVVTGQCPKVRSCCFGGGFQHKEQSMILIIGGDGRSRPTTEEVRFIPSGRYGGQSRIAHAARAIRGGGVRCVVLLTRWLGHSEFKRISRACRAAGTRLMMVTGGIGSALKTIGGVQ